MDQDRAFEDAVERLGQVVDGIFEAAAPLREGIDAWRPSADSDAMAAIKWQQVHGLSEQHYVERAGLLAALLLYAAEDNAVTMTRAWKGGHPTVFAHHSLGRASIECTARAFTLLDPGVPFDTRLSRFLNERLVSLRLLKRAAAPYSDADLGEVDALIDEILNDHGPRADLRPLRASRGKPKYLHEGRLSNEAAIKLVIAQPAGDTADDQALARTLYRRLSAMTHGDASDVFRTLTQMDDPIMFDPLAPDRARAAVTASVGDIALVCRAIVLCYNTTIHRYLQYFGVDTEPLQPAIRKAHEVFGDMPLD